MVINLIEFLYENIEYFPTLWSSNAWITLYSPSNAALSNAGSVLLDALFGSIPERKLFLYM